MMGGGGEPGWPKQYYTIKYSDPVVEGSAVRNSPNAGAVERMIYDNFTGCTETSDAAGLYKVKFGFNFPAQCTDTRENVTRFHWNPDILKMGRLLSRQYGDAPVHYDLDRSIKTGTDIVGSKLELEFPLEQAASARQQTTAIVNKIVTARQAARAAIVLLGGENPLRQKPAKAENRS